MSREQVQVEVDGHKYRIRPWGARAGIKFSLEMGTVVGGALGALFGRIGGGKSILDEDAGNLIGSLETVPQLILNRGGSEFVIRLLVGTERQSEINEKLWIDVDDPVLFDDIYAQNYGELLGLLWKVLDVNYGPFSGASGSKWIAALQRFASMSAPATHPVNATP